MTLVTQKFTKIKSFSFVQFSWPNQMLQSPIFMTKSNVSIFSNFHDLGYTKLHKIETLQFCPIFMTRVHQNSQKSKASVLSNFHDPRVHKTSLKSKASVLSNFHDPEYTKLHKNQTLPNFHDPGYTKIHKNQIL